MHEMSVALEVCRIAEARLAHEKLDRLVGVGVVVGDQAGIEPTNLQFCLDTLLAQPPFRGATVKIERCVGDSLRVDYLEVDE
ncbi:MAG TPA: hydrogenase/urease maturation nickel metallochaperone HypA [Gemmatimonadaceae bacterium]|jgi:Zn finger protein HypA/HybF involved in hydrogenase expression